MGLSIWAATAGPSLLAQRPPDRPLRERGGFEDSLHAARLAPRPKPAHDDISAREPESEEPAEDEGAGDAALEAPHESGESPAGINAAVVAAPLHAEPPVLTSAAPNADVAVPVNSREIKQQPGAATAPHQPAGQSPACDVVNKERLAQVSAPLATEQPSVEAEAQIHTAGKAEDAALNRSGYKAAASSARSTTPEPAGSRSQELAQPARQEAANFAGRDVDRSSKPASHETRPVEGPHEGGEAQHSDARSTKSRSASLFDQKVQQWLESRRTGGENLPSGYGDANDASPAANGNQAGAGRRLALNISGAPATAAIRSAQGDDAAVALSRSLVHGAERITRRTGGHEEPGTLVHNQAAHAAAPARPSTSFAGVAGRTGHIVGQLLNAPSAEATEGVERAVQMMNAASRAGGRFNATLQLDPPDLGAMRVQVRMHQQAMTLQVEVESHRAQRLVESNLSQLRDALSQHGVRVDRAEVVVRTPDSSESQFDRPREDFDRSGTSTGGEPQFGATNQDSSPPWRQAPEDGGSAWPSEAIDTSAQRLAAAERGVSDINRTWATESSLNLVA